MNRNSTKMLRVDADNSFALSRQDSDFDGTQIKRIDTFANTMEDSSS
jgi:hypothetical protein